MMQPFAVLWDMDGVLVDTRIFHYQTWVDLLKNYQVHLTVEEFDRTFGMNNDTFLRIVFGPEITRDFVLDVGRRKEHLFRQMIAGQVRPMAGALTWLECFRKMGTPQVVASSAPPENVEALVREAGIGFFFKALVSGSSIPGKPAPDVFLLAADKAGFPPSRCLVIEDAIAGVEAAHRAGMRCIAVQTTHKSDALNAADLVLPGLEDLTEALLLDLMCDPL